MTTPARRITALAVIGVLAFAIVAGGLWFAFWKPVRHVDREHGFSILFTAEWEIWPPGDGATIRASRTIHDANGVISVLASPVENFPDAAAYRTWWIGATEKSMPGFARVKDGERETPAGKVPWTEYIYRAQPGDFRLQALQFFVLAKGKGQEKDRGFIITGTAAPGVFERFRADFLEAVDSFRAETPGGVTPAR